MKYNWLVILASHVSFALVLQDEDQLTAGRQIWEIKKNPDGKIKIRNKTDEPEKIKIDPAKAYILQDQQSAGIIDEFSIYYLVSRETNINIKYKAVESVIQLRNTLGVQKIRFGMTMNNPVSIHRETYNQESSIFKSKLSEFNIPENEESIPLRRLYKISKVNNEIRFQQVPVHFSELNSSHTFVFDSGKSITLFSVDSDDQELETAANNIAIFMYNNNDYEAFNRDNEFLNCLEWASKDDDNCYSEFISQLEECPEKHIERKISNNEVKEIPDVPDYELYKLSNKNTKNVEPEFILDNTKNLKSLNEQNACYIYILEKVKEILIYIRDFTITEEVEKCLKYGEKLSANNDYLVSVVEKSHLNTQFIVIFKEIMSLFSNKEISFLNSSLIKRSIFDILP